MLRIHFQPDDILRLRIATEPDPLWETVLSLFRIRRGDGPMILKQWRLDAIRRSPQSVLQMLLPLTPGGYFPDFLNPAESSISLEAGIEAVLATPRPRLRHELGILARQQGSLPTWVCALADGDRETLERLGRALRIFYQSAIEPYWAEARAHVEADRAKRARICLDGGIESLLNSFHPLIRWNNPFLEIAVPFDDTVYLNGRGLRMIPSYVSHGSPDMLQDPELTPVLVYPLEHDLLLSARTRGPGSSLAALIGPTRATLLDSIESGRSTTELARRVGISPGSVSQHTTVLREAGLLMTNRVGRAVVHTLTPLGSAVLHAHDDPVVRAPTAQPSSR
ncbi:MAG TPA: winged helix-turn-helix domain-containing protein [Kineosporiaceae bacterium]|nr:winged helix-turn-helix domain-containing protein [Kineosporiaceae bacterium]